MNNKERAEKLFWMALGNSRIECQGDRDNMLQIEQALIEAEARGLERAAGIVDEYIVVNTRLLYKLIRLEATLVRRQNGV